MSNNNTNISSKQIVDLRWEIAKVRAKQEFYLDTIQDAALAAVNQVQDKQIEFFDSGPELSTTTLIVDAILSIAAVLPRHPLAQVGVAAAKPIVTDLLTDLVRFRKGVAEVSHNKSIIIVDELTVELLRDAQALAISESEVRKYPDPNPYSPNASAKYRLFRQFTMDVAYSYLESESKLRKYEMLGAREDDPKQGGLDSPGASLLNAATSFVTDQRKAIQLAHDAYDMQVSAGRVDQERYEAVKKLMTRCLGLLSSNDLLQLREDLKLLFEAAIWETMFPLSQWTQERKADEHAPTTMSAYEADRRRRPRVAPRPSEREVAGVSTRTWSPAPERLEEYWVKRFSRFFDKRGADWLGKVKWLFEKVASPHISLMRMATLKAQSEKAVVE